MSYLWIFLVIAIAIYSTQSVESIEIINIRWMYLERNREEWLAFLRGKYEKRHSML